MPDSTARHDPQGVLRPSRTAVFGAAGTDAQSNSSPPSTFIDCPVTLPAVARYSTALAMSSGSLNFLSGTALTIASVRPRVSGGSWTLRRGDAVGPGHTALTRIP